FIADGYSAYPLAAQQFVRELGDSFQFDITQVIGLTNNDAVSKEFRPYKQMIERLNRTFKSTYRVSCGYD
ncbi:DDE-type integrase/transposase/recombinase, partial [Bacteroides uniformis]